MTSAVEVLASLRRRGVRLWADRGMLRFEAASGTLNSADLECLRQLKPEIVRLLSAAEPKGRLVISQRPVAAECQLTPLQRVWTAPVNASAPSTKFGVFGIQVLGELPITALSHACSGLIATHDILRAHFVYTSEGVRMTTRAHKSLAVDFIDLQSMPSQPPSPQLAQGLQALADSRHSLFAGPLVEVHCYRLSPREHILAFGIDRTLSDCESNRILCQEIIYSLIRAQNDTTEPPPRPQLQFADYAFSLERDRISWLDTHYRHWRDTFIELRERHPVAIEDRSEEPQIDAQLSLALDAQLTRQLLDVARVKQLFPALFVLVACICAFSRLTGRRSLIVTVADSGRHSPELERMVGWLVNYLYLRIELPESHTLLQVLSGVVMRLEDAQRHCDFNRLPELFESITPDLYFSWLATDAHLVAPNSGGDGTGLQLNPYPTRAAPIQPCQGFSFELGDLVTGKLAYNARVWSKQQMQQLTAVFESTLREVLRNCTVRAG